MRTNEPQIKCTIGEHLYLLEERLQAMKACPDLSFQRWRHGEGNFWSWTAKLDILRRDRDGSLIARIVISKAEGGTRYVRKLRVLPAQGLSSGKALYLRRTSRAG